MALPPTEEQVRQLVRQSLERLLGSSPQPVRRRGDGEPRRPLLDAEWLAGAASGSTVTIPPGALVTPLARDLALERGITLVTEAPVRMPAGQADQTVAIGADHGGYALKEQLKPVIAKLGWQVTDCGAASGDKSVDYPDFAYAVARLVADGRARWGIVVDGAGIGSCMVANKVPGVRAAMCYDLASAANSREHNHANVLTLGAGLIGPALAQQIVKLWLETPFGSDRHARRVAKITEIEQRFLKNLKRDA